MTTVADNYAGRSLLDDVPAVSSDQKTPAPAPPTPPSSSPPARAYLLVVKGREVVVRHDRGIEEAEERRALGGYFYAFADGQSVRGDAVEMFSEVTEENAVALEKRAEAPVLVQQVGPTPAASADPFEDLDYALWPLEKLEAEEKVEKARCDPNNYGNTSTDLLEIRAAIEKKRAASGPK